MPLSHCPYSVSYLSEDTSRSGYLFEDQLHLVSVGGNKQQSSIQASILIGYIHLLDTWLSNVSHPLSKVFGYVCFASEIFLLKYPSDNFWHDLPAVIVKYISPPLPSLPLSIQNTNKHNYFSQIVFRKYLALKYFQYLLFHFSSLDCSCGSQKSGEYLKGIAPDGLMGLGPGDIYVPSLLAKSGLIAHSFSFCYDKSYSGRLYLGDQGPPSQSFTSFSPLKGFR